MLATCPPENNSAVCGTAREVVDECHSCVEGEHGGAMVSLDKAMHTAALVCRIAGPQTPPTPRQYVDPPVRTSPSAHPGTGCWGRENTGLDQALTSSELMQQGCCNSKSHYSPHISFQHDNLNKAILKMHNGFIKIVSQAAHF